MISVGQSIERLQAYANGVPAKSYTVGEATQLSDGYQSIRATFQLELPADSSQLITVYAATEERLVGASDLIIEREPIKPEDSDVVVPKKMLIVAAGVSNYRDSRIPSLENGSANARNFVQTIQAAATGLYEAKSFTLADSEVNRANWRTLRNELSENLDSFHADDLIVLYLSGTASQTMIISSTIS